MSTQSTWRQVLTVALSAAVACGRVKPIDSIIDTEPSSGTNCSTELPPVLVSCRGEPKSAQTWTAFCITAEYIKLWRMNTKNILSECLFIFHCWWFDNRQWDIYSSTKEALPSFAWSQVTLTQKARCGPHSLTLFVVHYVNICLHSTPVPVNH